MLRRVFFLSPLFVIVALVAGVVMFGDNLSAKASGPRIHKNELSEHGVLIINSADAPYENDVHEWLKDKKSSFQEAATTLKPFSVFVDNTTDKDLIAYKLVWNVTNPDGQIATYSHVYSEPECLMGISKPTDIDPNSRMVKRNSRRFSTIVSIPSDEGESGLGSGDRSSFVTNLASQLRQATDITVSIEGALFEDGTFIGTNDEYFKNVKADITSKHDLLLSIRSESEEVGSSNDIFDRLTDLANSEASFPRSGGSFKDYYNYFRKMHAKEILNMRRAIGNDSRTIATSIDPLKNKWIIPFDVLRPENNR